MTIDKDRDGEFKVSAAVSAVAHGALLVYSVSVGKGVFKAFLSHYRKRDRYGRV